MKKRILVVDDEYAVRELLQTTFNLIGFEVVLARDGREALFYLNNNQFDLIVTDIGMPEMTGDKMIAQIKQYIPIVVISGGWHDQEAAKKIKMQDGRVKAFLPKPFSLVELINVIKNILGS